MRLEIDFPTTLLSEADEAVFLAARTAEEPSPGDEHEPGDGVPKGSLTAARHGGGTIYPGVSRDYSVYVPAQHDGSHPANLMVFQDGQHYLRDTGIIPVLDNLIAKGELAPTIAVFIQPGALDNPTPGAQHNRSFEYDSLTDAYVRMLLDDLLPIALDGLAVTEDPARRAICGLSSGAICAFNAAWERPDQFGLVLSHYGSYTNIRGGHAVPSRVRANGAKPIRVFMQDGNADLNLPYGNWPIANFDMAAALAFRDYDMRFEFGLGGHTLHHPNAILPQTLRWLFRN